MPSGSDGRVIDLLVAATAHAHDAIVYTRNPDVRAGLDDLTTIYASLIEPPRVARAPALDHSFEYGSKASARSAVSHPNRNARTGFGSWLRSSCDGV